MVAMATKVLGGVFIHQLLKSDAIYRVNLIYQRKTQLTIFCCSVSLATVYLGFDRFTTEN
jgi:hypothetical protein